MYNTIFDKWLWQGLKSFIYSSALCWQFIYCTMTTYTCPFLVRFFFIIQSFLIVCHNLLVKVAKVMQINKCCTKRTKKSECSVFGNLIFNLHVILLLIGNEYFIIILKMPRISAFLGWCCFKSYYIFLSICQYVFSWQSNWRKQIKI